MGVLIVNESGDIRAIATKNISDVGRSTTALEDNMAEQVIVVQYEPVTRTTRAPQQVRIQDTYAADDAAEAEQKFTDILDLMAGETKVVNLSDFEYPVKPASKTRSRTKKADAQQETPAETEAGAAEGEASETS